MLHRRQRRRAAANGFIDPEFMPRPRRPVSMTDVAIASGVSVTTVSHVVNRTRPVSSKTEAAVLAALAATGYVPDGVVRSERTVDTRIIGLAISVISDTHFTDLVRSIESDLTARGYSLLLADTHDDPKRELRAVADILSRGVEGMLLAPSATPEAALEYLSNRNVPAVVIDRLIDSAVDQIASENIESTAKLAQHLASLGHRRIGMICGKTGLTTSMERIQGFRLGLDRAGVEVDETLISSGESTLRGARKAFEGFLNIKPEIISDVFCEVIVGDIALLRANWKVVAPDGTVLAEGQSTEVAKKLDNGGWGYLIDCPSGPPLLS